MQQEGTNPSKWVTVTAGRYHSLGLKADGTMWTWGVNSYYNTGLGTAVGGGYTTKATEVPTKTGQWKYISQISSRYYFDLAIDKNDNLYAWGYSHYGSTGLGLAHNNSTAIPTRVGDGTGYRFVSAGFYHTLAVRTDGSLWAWGLQDNGMLGNGKLSGYIMAPERIGNATDWVYVQAGHLSSIGIKKDGSIWFWGHSGPLTNAAAVNYSTPTQQELQ